MYEALEPVTRDLTNLKATLTSPMSHTLVARSTSALDAVAQKLAEATPSAATDRDRANLQTLYRGFVAARRTVAHLHDLQTRGPSPR